MTWEHASRWLVPAIGWTLVLIGWLRLWRTCSPPEEQVLFEVEPRRLLHLAAYGCVLLLGVAGVALIALAVIPGAAANEADRIPLLFLGLAALAALPWFRRLRDSMTISATREGLHFQGHVLRWEEIDHVERSGGTIRLHAPDREDRGWGNGAEVDLSGRWWDVSPAIRDRLRERVEG